MSNRNYGKGPVPDRWLHCPRKSLKIIQSKFCAFKTPLSSDFDSQVPEDCRFSVKMLFDSLKAQRLKMGLWIDLTNTSRFYEKKEVEERECAYLKLSCKGHGETPDEKTTKAFVQVCKTFIQNNPLQIIGVHCTHGFNRTGLLIISYLVEELGMSVDAALAEFTMARPPGIYKSDYIQELYKRYDDIDDAPPAPERPAWCLDSYPENDDNDERTEGPSSNTNALPSRKRKREQSNKNPVFMAGVPGVKPLFDLQIMDRIQTRIRDICSYKRIGFPGSQPVSMCNENIKFLAKKAYRVSWKADGTRYMMFIQGNGKVYFADRDNHIYEVSGLRFPPLHDPKGCIQDTLLDGEMVIDIDKSNGKKYPRYLVYDVIMYDNRNVREEPFYPDRYDIIEDEILAGRRKAFEQGILIKDREPFSVRRKTFYELNNTADILADKFAKQLTHEPDGLIFQPSKASYVPGQSPNVLKWKPPSLNSVDFKLKILTETGMGIVPKKIGCLFVIDKFEVNYAKMKLTKQIKELDNKIIECKYENGQWVFMRERTDKSFPNSLQTANAVYESIRNPVTEEKLLYYIRKYQFREDDSNLMPPPPKRAR